MRSLWKYGENQRPLCPGVRRLCVNLTPEFGLGEQGPPLDPPGTPEWTVTPAVLPAPGSWEDWDSPAASCSGLGKSAVAEAGAQLRALERDVGWQFEPRPCALALTLCAADLGMLEARLGRGTAWLDMSRIAGAGLGKEEAQQRRGRNIVLVPLARSAAKNDNVWPQGSLGGILGEVVLAPLVERLSGVGTRPQEAFWITWSWTPCLIC